MGTGTPIWQIEGIALDSTGDIVADSLGQRVIDGQAAIATIDTEVGDIQTDTTAILVDTAAIETETDKIDQAATDGLAGTSNSLAYRVHEAERHLHSNERWFGLAVAPVGETHRADRIGTTTTPFQMDAGNVTWGSWLQILGSTDTPADIGMAFYDPHRIFFQAFERANSLHFVQIAIGTSGAAALTAGTYTEFVIQPTGAASQEIPVIVQARRAATATKSWARCLAVGQNTGTMDFWLGIHEYEG